MHITDKSFMTFYVYGTMMGVVFIFVNRLLSRVLRNSYEKECHKLP